MSIIDKACAWAKAIAFDDAHGYDQGSRWGPDYDCSSLVISSFKQAGVPLTATYTGNMRADMLAHGFRDVTAQVNQYSGAGLERGDVLLHERNHTALYIGSGQIVNAGGNERGGAVGGVTGDQTGREIAVIGYYRPSYGWDCVLRYTEKESGRPDQGIEPYAKEKETAPVTAGANTYVVVVKSGDSLWAIAERELGDGSRYRELQQLNGLAGTMIYPGQVLKLPRKTGEKRPGDPSPSAQDDEDDEDIEYCTVTVTVEKAALEWWKARAKKCNLTLGEMIDALADAAGYEP